MTTFDESQQHSEVVSRPRPQWLKLVLAALLTFVIAAIGYVWGSHRSGVVELHGVAYSTAQQIGASANGVAYNVPLDIEWKAADGGWHMDQTRPACLPPSAKRLNVTFGAVKWKRDGLGGYTVAWVDCSH